MILIIDDDIAVRSSLLFILKRAGYEAIALSSQTEALEYVRHNNPELIIMDMNYSLSTTGEEGLILLRQVKIFLPEVPVVLVTAWGNISLAVEGMRAGAFDFITKPWDNYRMLEVVQTALAIRSKSSENISPVVISPHPAFKKIIGNSSALQQVLQTVQRIAATQAPVLITGESGTGKEMIAEAIHHLSRRNEGPFVKVNLGGIAQNLFESEMFGHKKGAFTDALFDRVGRFELANKGTIFLDEIGDLDPTCQVKLLRVLQDQTYEVLGDSRSRRTDVRVVSATNRNLSEMIQKQLFREDLYYRINLINIHLPPLRERTQDIPLLVAHFTNEVCKINALPKIRFDKGAMEMLQKQPFPGNIRELKNLVERTVLVSTSDVIFKEDIVLSHHSLGTMPLTGGTTLDELEYQAILCSFQKHGGNISQMATELGITRQALYRRLEKYGIKFD